MQRWSGNKVLMGGGGSAVSCLWGAFEGTREGNRSDSPKGCCLGRKDSGQGSLLLKRPWLGKLRPATRPPAQGGICTQTLPWGYLGSLSWSGLPCVPHPERVRFFTSPPFHSRFQTHLLHYSTTGSRGELTISPALTVIHKKIKIKSNS